jgi:hypothetical protein
MESPSEQRRGQFMPVIEAKSVADSFASHGLIDPYLTKPVFTELAEGEHGGPDSFSCLHF